MIVDPVTTAKIYDIHVELLPHALYSPDLAPSDLADLKKKCCRKDDLMKRCVNE